VIVYGSVNVNGIVHGIVFSDERAIESGVDKWSRVSYR